MRETNRSIWQHGRFRSRVAESSATAERMETLRRCLPNFVPFRARGLDLTTSRAAAIILAKELRLEFRTRELLTATVIFALVVVVLFSFAFDPTAAESRRYGPGLLWIAFLFAGSLMLNPSFSREQNNETLDALRMAPISPFPILLGKMLANFIFMSVAELILVPVFAVLYNISLADLVCRLLLEKRTELPLTALLA